MATFVLIHGAWHDARVWRGVGPMLEARGHQVITPELPGNGVDTTPPGQVSLSTYAESVGRVVAGADEPVILVGHSMAGVVISCVAEAMPERVRKLVYLAAFMLPDGLSILDFYARFATPDMQGARAALRLSADGTYSTIDPEQAKHLFMNTCAVEVAAEGASHLGPQPAQPRKDPVRVSPARWGTVPRIYFSTLRDNTVFLPLQKRMYAELAPCPVIEFDCDHSPFYSMPSKLAEALLILA